MSYDLLPLFSKPVYVEEDIYSFDKSELDLVDSLEKVDSIPGLEATSDKFVLNRQEFKGIRDFIEDRLNFYVHDILQIVDDVEFYITQSWINYMTVGGYHQRHDHPNSVVSGVLFIQCGTEGPYLTFHGKDNMPFGHFEFRMKQYTTYNCQKFGTPTKPGKLVLFPSGLEHYVGRNNTDVQRITLSFNTYVRGSIGDPETAAGLDLR